MWAAYMDAEDCVRYLISQGSDITLTDNSGFTALHWAAIKGHFKSVKTLLSFGANPNAKDHEGETPSKLAIKKGFVDLGKYLVESEKSAGPRLSQTQSNWLWFSVTFALVVFVLLSVSNFPFFIGGVILSALAIFGVKFFLGHLWPGADQKNPTWVAIVSSTYTISAYVYFKTVIYYTSSYTVETILFFAINFMFVPLYIRLITGDPGFIEKGNSAEWKSYQAELEKNEALPQFCLSCMVKKPIRAKHCRSCDRCVAKFDHHCGWINNCVGAKNVIPFLTCLTLVVINHMMFFRLAWITLFSIPDSPESLLPLNYSVPIYFEKEPLIFLLTFFHLMNIGWLSSLLYSLLNGIIRNNMTTNEYLNGTRYDYLKHPQTGEFYNPFNKGPTNNLKELLFPTIDWYHLYHLKSDFSV